MVTYIDAHRGAFGVDPICKVLPIAPSTYYDVKAKERTPELRCARAIRDEFLQVEIQRVWGENFCVYGVRKVWRQLNREDIDVARCTTERLMNKLDIQGVVRGRRIKTTLPADLADRPLDLVKRDFRATRPNALWVADLTYVATWRGFVYVAFIIDAFARRIVGWRVSTSLRTDIALDALEQALHERQIGHTDALVHHSDRVCSTWQSAMHSVLTRQELALRLEALVTRTTTRSQRQLTGCTKRKLSDTRGLGKASSRSNSRRLNGSNGSTTAT